MASISELDNGRRAIQFKGVDGKRQTIRLGKISKEDAEPIKRHVERILTAKITAQPLDRRTVAWIGELEAPLLDKLARVGLLAARELPIPLGPFLDSYTSKRNDVKPATKEVWGQVVRNLKGHFGEGRDIKSVTIGDAEAFKAYLINEKLSSTTVHKRLQFARAFFRAALKRKHIEENPFAEVSSKAVMDGNRMRFVTREDIDQILAVASLDWRLIISLARYGGLRCPSEVLSLRWQDIDWQAGRITVSSPKTEHHEGKGSRVIPMFPELRGVLQEARAKAETNAEYVVNGYRDKAVTERGWRNCNLRTQFERLIKRAGLTPWPRLFHNLRSTRETELAAEYPIQVVTAWLGNTPRIALKHYLQVTDGDFTRAAGGSACNALTNGEKSPKGAAESGASNSKTMQNPVQRGGAVRRNNSHQNSTTPSERRGCASHCDSMRDSAKTIKRRGQDSNLRTSYPVTGLANPRFRPLSHLSVLSVRGRSSGHLSQS